MPIFHQKSLWFLFGVCSACLVTFALGTLFYFSRTTEVAPGILQAQVTAGELFISWFGTLLVTVLTPALTSWGMNTVLTKYEERRRVARQHSPT